MVEGNASDPEPAGLTHRRTGALNHASAELTQHAKQIRRQWPGTSRTDARDRKAREQEARNNRAAANGGILPLAGRALDGLGEPKANRAGAH